MLFQQSVANWLPFISLSTYEVTLRFKKTGDPWSSLSSSGVRYWWTLLYVQDEQREKHQDALNSGSPNSRLLNSPEDTTCILEDIYTNKQYPVFLKYCCAISNNVLSSEPFLPIWWPRLLSYHICIRTLIPSISSVFILKSTPAREKRELWGKSHPENIGAVNVF